MSNSFLFGNLAGTTLAAPISSTATTISVAAGTGALFPQPAAGQYFALRLISASNSTYTEIVYVTAISGDVLTVVRAQESTAPLSFNASDFAKHVLTAGALNSFAQKISVVQVIPETTFYINGATGNDSNNGLTPSTAFATGQGAVNYISQFYASSVTINVAAGTYVIPAGGAFAYITRCLIQNWTFVGSGATTCLINASATGALGFYSQGPKVIASGFGVTTSYFAFNAAINTIFSLYDNNVTLLSGGQAFGSSNGSYMQIYGTWTISGTGSNIFAAVGATIALGYHDVNTTSTLNVNFSSVTITGNNAYANNCGIIIVFAGYVTLSGTVTGSRYTSSTNGVINTNLSGANFFPGTVAGTATTGEYI